MLDQGCLPYPCNSEIRSRVADEVTVSPRDPQPEHGRQHSTESPFGGQPLQSTTIREPQQKFTISWFWRPDARDQGVNSTQLPARFGVEPVPASSGFRQQRSALALPGFQIHCSPLCLPSQKPPSSCLFS